MHIQRVGTFVKTEESAWPIEGVLSGMTVLWGRPGLGKSFVAVSMAASIASGRPWIGRKTNPGRVVYVAGEGGGEAVDRRFRTALAQWTVDAVEDPAPIDIVTPGVTFTDKGQCRELIDKIDELSAVAPSLIVVDTLSRCFEGDENKQEFMGAFVNNLDRIKAHYKCCVLIIHHESDAGKIRGSSVLPGAVDVSWQLSGRPCGDSHKGLGLTMISKKLRERDATNSTIHLRVKSVLTTDVDGDPEFDELGDRLTSLIIKPTREQIDLAKRIVDAFPGMEGSGYAELAMMIPADKADFDSALSLIITYPGTWGIKYEGGRYVKAEKVDEGYFE